MVPAAPETPEEETSDDGTPGEGASAASLDRLQAWLVLLPLAVLCLPGELLSADGAALDPFQDAPDTTSIGLGISALAALPATLLATVRARGSRLLGLPLLYLLLAFAAYHLQRSPDSFGAWRAVVGLAAAAGWAIAGSALGPSGRRLLAGGLPVITALLLVGSFAADRGAALGNTGDFSEAALPGAVLGAGLFLRRSGPLSVLGLAALGLFALRVGSLPVYAGLLGLGAAATAAAAGASLASAREAASDCARRLRLLMVALLLGLLPTGVTLLGGDAGAPGSPAAEAAPTTTGGFDFRLRTWARVPDMVRVHAPLGAGPGQFQAAFPPFRDAAEIEASSFDRREPTPIEVEHAHSDPVTAVAELGLVGGSAFALLLLLTLWRAARALTGTDVVRRDLALAVLAVLANSTVNSPLLYGPVAPLIGFVLMGAVLGRDAEAAAADREPVDWFQRVAPALALGALVLLAPRAVGLVRYGRTLAELPGARIVLEDGREKLDAGRLEAILDRAAEHAPESPILLEKRAEWMSATSAPVGTQREHLARWLRRRPHSFAALLRLGALEARARDLDAAEEAFHRALLLDPGAPTLLQNLVRLGCDRRDPEAVEEALVMLESKGRLDPDFVRALALDRALEGRLEVAAPLVTRWREQAGLPPVDLADANSTYRAQKAAAERGAERERLAFLVATKVLFGLEDLSRGSAGQATTQFRLAYQKARDAGVDTSALRLMLAAAFAAEGDLAVATGWLETGPPRKEDHDRLPPAAREALATSGLLGGSPGAAAPR